MYMLRMQTKKLLKYIDARGERQLQVATFPKITNDFTIYFPLATPTTQNEMVRVIFLSEKRLTRALRPRSRGVSSLSTLPTEFSTLFTGIHAIFNSYEKLSVLITMFKLVKTGFSC